MKQTRQKRDGYPTAIQDAAKAAGVPALAVSRVINEEDDVAAETYEKETR